MHDVVVAGGGPAGWAVAAACAGAGLRTALVDPAPDRPWRPTYAAWRGELADDVPVAASGRACAVGAAEHDLGWDYVVLDNAALHARLAGCDVRVHRDRVTGSTPTADGVRVHLAGGAELPAAVLVDATGARPPSRGRPAAEQTAVGVVVDAATAAPLVGPGRALFMDWRPDHGEDGWPTFLYAVPVGPDRVVLEETSLARRPALGLPALRRRLHARLARHGVAVGPAAAEERVRFPVDGPLPSRAERHGPVVRFGAAAPLVHPATGYSVATALRLAPRLAGAVRDGLAGAGPADAAARAHAAVWPPAALAVHLLRRRGLEVLLALPPHRVPGFFDAFLALPEHHRWAYLTAREDVARSAAAMNALFTTGPWWLRRHLVRRGLDPRAVVSA